MDKKKTAIIVILVILLLTLAGMFAYKLLTDKEPKKPNSNVNNNEPTTPPTEYQDTDYVVKFIKTVNSSQKGNYLVSPYSVEIALNMLKDGTKNNSEKQIADVIGAREIPVFESKNRISVSNGAFIKEDYKDYVSSNYYNRLASYKADLLFDKFENPDVINKWVNEKTYGMIPHLLDNMSPEFVLGIANAVAIDVEWYSNFECNLTRSAEFTKTDGSKINVEMMNKSVEDDKSKYFETEDAKGIIMSYMTYSKEGEVVYNGRDNDDNVVPENEQTTLEFVGILPNGNVKDFIENLTMDKLNNFDKETKGSDQYDIRVSLPRFSYSFNLGNFKEVLKAMGITDVFIPGTADLTGIIETSNLSKMGTDGLYVAEAIHKTYIDLNEKGTKAAAVTYFGIDKNAAHIEEKEKIQIEFNKPFVYMIRDSKTKEVLFFGVVEEPNLWKGSTCNER